MFVVYQPLLKNNVFSLGVVVCPFHPSSSLIQVLRV